MAGKKRRKNRPAPAQQAVPVRRGNEQVRYVQPGRPASYPGAGQAYEQPVAQEGKKRKPRHFYDYSLLFIIIFLTVFGLVMIYSASSYTAQLSSKYNGNSAYFMQRQAMIAAIGFFTGLSFSGKGSSSFLCTVLCFDDSSFTGGKSCKRKEKMAGCGTFQFPAYRVCKDRPDHYAGVLYHRER